MARSRNLTGKILEQNAGKLYVYTLLFLFPLNGNLFHLDNF